MKHIGLISRNQVEKADALQDMICSISHAIAGFVEEKGGISPLVTFLDEKCDLPTPNP